MIKKLTLFALLFVMAQAMLSCSKSDEAEQSTPPQLSVVTDDVMKVAFTGNDAVTIQFICNKEWKAVLTVEGDDKSWIAFKGNDSGAGSGTLVLDVKANAVATARNASVKITSGALTADVQIKQDPKLLNITFKHPSVLFTTAELEEIKQTYDAKTAASLTKAVDFVFTRGKGGLNYNVETVTDDEKRVANDCALLYKRLTGPTGLARNLALAHALSNPTDANYDAYATKAVAIMYDWADACKAVQYPVGVTGGTEDEPSTGAGMYLSRGMWPFFVCYDMFRGTKYMTSAQAQVIEEWFRNTVVQIKASMNAWHNNDYFNKQEWQNHLVAHTMGLLTIGYVLEDASLVQFAIDSPENPRDFYELIQGNIFMAGDTPCHRERANAPAVQTGEIYDRYRHDTAPLKGLQYASLSMSLLNMAARTCYNNGIDMFAYTAPTGENIRLSYEFYAQFYKDMDTSIKGGYYTGEDDRISKAGDMQGLFEMAYRYYPDSEPIKSVIDAIPDRGSNDKDKVHDQFGYTRLFSVAVDKTH